VGRVGRVAGLGRVGRADGVDGTVRVDGVDRVDGADGPGGRGVGAAIGRELQHGGAAPHPGTGGVGRAHAGVDLVVRVGRVGRVGRLVVVMVGRRLDRDLLGVAGLGGRLVDLV